ncbi:MAG TPA: response regulator, partial [Acidimicrobiales bacterium]|nr:response regulator [Acidimicrobiales bacterium]
MVADSERIRVLVVEDEESYRQALSSGLSREGFDVDVAADGYEALRRFAERTPDIVLLDLVLPGVRGIEVCRRMRSLAPVPIVMVSAVDAELDVVLGFELGAAGYVTKPFRLRELVARI